MQDFDKLSSIAVSPGGISVDGDGQLVVTVLIDKSTTTTVPLDSVVLLNDGDITLANDDIVVCRQGKQYGHTTFRDAMVNSFAQGAALPDIPEKFKAGWLAHLRSLSTALTSRVTISKAQLSAVTVACLSD